MLASLIGVSSDSRFQSFISKKKQQWKRGGLGGIVKAGGGAVKAGGGGGKAPSPADAVGIGVDVADAAGGGGGDNEGSTKTRKPGAISTSSPLGRMTRIIESPTGRYAIHPYVSGTMKETLISTGPYSGRIEGGANRVLIEGNQYVFYWSTRTLHMRLILIPERMEVAILRMAISADS